MKRLVVVTDLGSFKAYELQDDPLNTKPKLEMVDSFEFTGGGDKISKKLSDSAGRFNDGSTADNHGVVLEDQRRHMQAVANRVGELLAGDEYAGCYFAAASEINQRILEFVPASARAKIEKNLSCNLVHANGDQLIRHFAN
jgi:hypothetical protein